MTTITEVQTTQVYQVFIKATPEQVWAGITQPEYVDRYYHGCRLDAPLEAGGRWVGRSPDLSKVWIDSEILEFDPPRRLSHGWLRGVGHRRCRCDLRGVCDGTIDDRCRVDGLWQRTCERHISRQSWRQAEILPSGSLLDWILGALGVILLRRRLA